MKPPIASISFAVLALSLSPAIAQQVGPGSTIANNGLDDTNTGRVNVDNTVTLTLAPGTYTATLFNFDAGKAGTVTPFLARENSPGSNTFTALAVGATQTFTGVTLDGSRPFGGSAQFTLAATTIVFAGIATPNGAENPIAFANSGTTDHEGGNQPAATYVIAVGGPVPADGTFSNPNLARSYAFSVTVVPEPSTAAMILGGFGMVGLLRRRR